MVDDCSHAVTKQLPASFAAPANEWYLWKPSPRLNKNVHVLLTLDPSNYPIGVKDIITGGDLPVVWTNTKYRMIYMNMGHGDKIFTDATQNLLIAQSLLWVGNSK
ncbi:MAG TPA: ThuA domain-containing protein [Candidatus Acidoferrum sp.]|nr:ThuA domain-containing protein [Candidatus Acidoferrum sp.]